MRTWTFYQSHGISHRSFARDSPPLGTWKDFMPYTNAIWIYYLFDYIIKKYEGSATPLNNFLKETKELRENLDPDRRISDGGFRSAAEILDYCVKQGWIDEVDMIDLETSRVLDETSVTVTATSGSQSTDGSHES